jgi:hypothetical protein
MERRYPDLDLDEDLRLERVERRVLRVAWPLLYALLAAIALGLLGHGPLAAARAGEPGDPLELEWRRFATARSETELVATVRASADVARLRVDRAWLARVEVRSVAPEPLRVVTRDDAIEFEFAAVGGAPVRARLVVENPRPGRLHGWVQAGEDARHAFSQLVFP